MTDLTGKVALITGASTGLGAATARVFAERGATVRVRRAAPHAATSHSARWKILNVHSGDSPMPRSADSTSSTGTRPTLKFADPRYGDAVHDDRYRPTISHGARYTSGLMSVLK